MASKTVDQTDEPKGSAPSLSEELTGALESACSEAVYQFAELFELIVEKAGKIDCDEDGVGTAIRALALRGVSINAGLMECIGNTEDEHSVSNLESKVFGRIEAKRLQAARKGAAHV